MLAPFLLEKAVVLMPLITTICVLAVVIVGLLVMTQATSLEGPGAGIWRGFLLVVLGVVALWILRTAMLSILICVLVWLKQALLGPLFIILGVIALGLLLRAVALWATKGNARAGTANKEKS